MTNPVSAVWQGVQTAFLRFPALMMNATGLIMIGELGMRTLENLPIVPAMQFNVDRNSFFGKMNTRISPYVQPVIEHVHLRPFGARNENNEYQLATKTLLISACVSIVFSNFTLEFVRLTSGNLPSIYNRVLQYISPFRFASEGHPLVRRFLGY